MTVLSGLILLAVSGNNTCVSPHELERFAKSVISAYDTGIIMTWKRSEDNMWSYGSSIFFAITVITTIGKTNITNKLI